MRKSILIVEDERNIAEMHGMILNSEYEIYFADNGKDAVKVAKEFKPDLVVLDLRLPKVDGFEVCRRIKDDPTTKHAKVVMVTALKTRDDEKKGFEVGADDYIMKPFDPDELLHVVNQQIGK